MGYRQFADDAPCTSTSMGSMQPFHLRNRRGDESGYLHVFSG